MKKQIITLLLILLIITNKIYSQSAVKYVLPEPVITELNRLEEAYKILDQFANSVWEGWNDYIDFPFLMTFQNGLRVLVGHPAPTSEFILYPDRKVHDLAVCIDTTKLNKFLIQLPLRCGGGVIPFGNFNNKRVTIVNLNFNAVDAGKMIESDALTGENHILVFIHELMHCYQDKILKMRYGNLDLNPYLDYALYSDIEGQALALAYKQSSLEESLPYLRDFCIARGLKIKDMSEQEKNQASSDEFREGEAVYSEVVILENVKRGFESFKSMNTDSEYHRFENPDIYMEQYFKRLETKSGKTLELYEKNYEYGCFEALLLQRYFPGWQKEIESGKWLDQILRKRIDITADDSLLVLKRFKTIYGLDQLKVKHEKVITERNNTYNMLTSRKGKTYIISMKPIRQPLSREVNKSLKNHKLGLIEMYPDGIGDMNFDGISLSVKPVPAEINELYYIKVVDTGKGRSGKAYTITCKSKDDSGYYYDATVTTPLFTLKAPKVSIRESKDRVKIIVHSRI